MKYFLSILFLLLPCAAQAATLRVGAPAHVGVGQVFEVILSADAPSAINAYSGVIDVGALHVVSVSDGNSIASAWVVRPTIQGGSVSFAGITAGGYQGAGGFIVKLLLRAQKADTVTITVHDPLVLLADGKGTADKTVVQSAKVVVAGEGSTYNEPTDVSEPESFNVYVVQVEGQWYAVFATLDKGSGIQGYEIAERRLPFETLDWKSVANPAVLNDQYLTSTIYVRATDRMGNARVSVVHRAHLLRPFEWFVGCIIIVCALSSFLVRRFFFVRRG